MRRFKKDFLIENIKCNVTMSIGISLYPKNGTKDLLKQADEAMYYVKKHGKNNFCLFSESQRLS